MEGTASNLSALSASVQKDLCLSACLHEYMNEHSQLELSQVELCRVHC